MGRPADYDEWMSASIVTIFYRGQHYIQAIG